MVDVNFFNSVQNLEPRCPRCNTIIDYGVTTEFDEKIEKHRCKTCSKIID